MWRFWYLKSARSFLKRLGNAVRIHLMKVGERAWEFANENLKKNQICGYTCAGDLRKIWNTTITLKNKYIKDLKYLKIYFILFCDNIHINSLKLYWKNDRITYRKLYTIRSCCKIFPKPPNKITFFCSLDILNIGLNLDL